jgi:radical SAM protein with 4Fe4S-binding SPASM domain
VGVDASSKGRLPLVADAARKHLPLASHPRPVDRAWRPHYAIWEVTLRCDLSCQHCSSRAGRARDDELSTAEALDVVAQMADLGVEEVILIGGEAYLRPDWLALVASIRARGMRCGIVTGGRGLTRDLAKAASDAGVQTVSVSVDGQKATHDRLRGVRGSFEAALAAIESVRATGVQVSANTQVGRANLRDVPALFERLVEAGIRAWQVQLTVPMGRAADDPELLLEPYQMLEVMPMLARLKSRADAAGVLFWPGNNVGYFGPHEEALRDVHAGCHRGSCGAGRSALGIESNGNVKGCPSLPSDAYVGGNVREHRLETIWERAPALRFTRERTVADLWGHCATCYYAEDCLGGCSWTAHSITGRPGNNPYCHHRTLVLLRQGIRERIVLRERAPGRSFDLAVFDLVEEAWPQPDLSQAQAVARGDQHWLAPG